MGRLARNTAVLFKNEATYGTDIVPVGATDACLLRKFDWKHEIKSVNSFEVRPYMGGSKDIVTNSFFSGTFEVALGGSGALGVAPFYSRFFRAACFAESITAATRVDYTPVSTGLESASMYFYDDGVLRKALGVRVNITSLKFGYGDVPVAVCAWQALDGGVTAAANPALTLTQWKDPVAVNSVNSGLLTLGCTYAAGALVGGTTYASKGIELQLGGKLDFMGLLGGEAIEFTDRDMKGSITLDLTAAQEVANLATVKAGTTMGIGIVHGTVAGYKSLLHLPNCQLKNPVSETMNGRRVVKYELNPVPTAGTGNDEFRFVAI